MSKEFLRYQKKHRLPHFVLDIKDLDYYDAGVSTNGVIMTILHMDGGGKIMENISEFRKAVALNDKKYIVVYQDSDYELVIDYLTELELNSNIKVWKERDCRVAVIENGSIVKGFYSSWNALNCLLLDKKD